MTQLKLIISTIKLYIVRLTKVANDEEKIQEILQEMRDWINDQIEV